MTTRAIVPNGDGEGSLGTSTAKWGAVYSSDPASGENSGQVPTTAWVQKLLADALAQAKLDAHPVGSYYWSNDSTSPATLFGGTWEALPAGYTLIAQGSGSDSFGSFTYTAGKKYGERKHPLTTDELPSHSHTVYTDNDFSAYYNPESNQPWKQGLINVDYYPQGITYGSHGSGYTGANQAHNNLPPSVAAYCWKRTA